MAKAPGTDGKSPVGEYSSSILEQSFMVSLSPSETEIPRNLISFSWMSRSIRRIKVGG